MIYQETSLPGVFIIEPELIHDERGFFACAWHADEFAQHGLNPEVKQCNISFNGRRGTVRGMHFQREPHQEIKLMRCTRGAIYDVAIDGVSLAMNYRAQFSKILRTSSYEALVQRIKTKLGEEPS